MSSATRPSLYHPITVILVQPKRGTRAIALPRSPLHVPKRFLCVSSNHSDLGSTETWDPCDRPSSIATPRPKEISLRPLYHNRPLHRQSTYGVDLAVRPCEPHFFSSHLHTVQHDVRSDPPGSGIPSCFRIGVSWIAFGDPHFRCGIGVSWIAFGDPHFRCWIGGVGMPRGPRCLHRVGERA